MNIIIVVIAMILFYRARDKSDFLLLLSYGSYRIIPCNGPQNPVLAPLLY